MKGLGRTRASRVPTGALAGRIVTPKSHELWIRQYPHVLREARALPEKQKRGPTWNLFPFYFSACALLDVARAAQRAAAAGRIIAADADEDAAFWSAPFLLMHVMARSAL